MCDRCLRRGQVNCQAGRWSDQSSLGSPCQRLCDAGYVCSAGSKVSNPSSCGGAQFYCPAGSAVPTAVTPGFYSVGGSSVQTRTDQALCPSPFNATSNYTAVYCSGNGLITVCPGGTYGDDLGLSTELCSGPCNAGYYCPAGSTNATAIACGGASL